MGGHPHRTRTTAFAVTVLVALALPMSARADRDFGTRLSTNLQGDVAAAGNTLLSCDPRSDSVCAAARDGTASGGANDNNSRRQVYVDVDDDPATFDSSAATLSIPSGARVIAASLYFGGRDQAGSNGQAPPDPAARNRVLLKAPGSSAYVPLAARLVDDAGSSGNPRRLYSGVTDVSDLVRAAGPGEYTVANVQLGTGQNSDQAGGWVIAVLYEDPTLPQRNVTVFDGFKFVTSRGEGGVPITLPLSGFLTPKSGPVRSTVGVTALEGDLGITGDSMTLNAKKLSNATNPASNFFNSTLSTTGSPFIAKRPSYVNQLGFDGDVLRADGFLTNSQSSTTAVLDTNGDGYAPSAVYISTDIFAPALNATKAVDLSEAELGEELTYTIGLENTGLDGAANVTLVDPIPAGTSYVPGSLEVTGGAPAGPKTDAVDSDQAEYDRAQRSVTFRLGTGAGNTVGGRLAVGDRAQVRFRVRVDTERLQGGARIVNRGTASFVSETLGQSGSVQTPEAVTVVQVPDLTIDKSHQGGFEAGGRTPYRLVVSNVGDAPTRGTATVTDQLPAELSFAGTPHGNGWVCDVRGRDLSCTRDDRLAAGSAWPEITFDALVSEDAEPGDIVNTAVVAGGGETNELNNSSTDTGPLPPPRIDLAIDKTAVGARFFPGQRVAFRLRVTNLGPNRATGVVVRDALPPGLELVSLSSTQGSCKGRSCAIGTLRRGQIETIDVVTVAGPDTGGRTLRDRASVTGEQPDVNPDNNRDAASVRVFSLVDLRVTKTTAAPTQPAGADVQFTVTVRNAGPSTARRVVLADLLPPGLDLVALEPSTGRCLTAPPGCDLGRLPRGGVVQVIVTARSRPDQAGQTFRNRAGALALGQLEATPADNYAFADVTLTEAPPAVSDLEVTKRTRTTTVVVGQPLRYRLDVTNRGPDPSPATRLTETPGGAVSVVTAEPSQGTCSTGPTIDCELGPLAVGATATIDVTVLPTAPGPLANAVSVISPSTDPAPEGNVAGVTVDARPRPHPRARLRLTKRAIPQTVIGGGLVTFRLSVRARRHAGARGVRLCDRLPGRLTVVRRGGATVRGGRACWEIGRLAAGRTRHFRLVVRADTVTRRTRVTNTAVLTADGLPTRRRRARVLILPRPGACVSRAAAASC